MNPLLETSADASQPTPPTSWAKVPLSAGAPVVIAFIAAVAFGGRPHSQIVPSDSLGGWVLLFSVLSFTFTVVIALYAVRGELQRAAALAMVLLASVLCIPVNYEGPIKSFNSSRLSNRETHELQVKRVRTWETKGKFARVNYSAQLAGSPEERLNGVYAISSSQYKWLMSHPNTPVRVTVSTGRLGARLLLRLELGSSEAP